jgi:hypothetical protein
MLVEQLARASGAELTAAVGKLPKVNETWNGIEVRLSGLVVFGPATLSPCPNSKPPCSTSTEP